MNKRVTGLGGVFFKCEDPAKIKEWYGRHLGLPVNDYGASFEWREVSDAGDKAVAVTAWSPFKASSKYFEPSTKPFMFNYRVENLAELIEALRSEGVEIVGKMEETPYGKFAWIMDPEGNKVELWEPIDEGKDSA